jgi:hypothetical protein
MQQVWLAGQIGGFGDDARESWSICPMSALRSPLTEMKHDAPH